MWAVLLLYKTLSVVLMTMLLPPAMLGVGISQASQSATNAYLIDEQTGENHDRRKTEDIEDTQASSPQTR